MVAQTVSALDVARATKMRGYPPVPNAYKDKKPLLTAWSTRVLDDEDLPTYFPDDGRPLNVGGLLGELAGGRVDVDLDAREAWSVAARLLPPTEAVFGRRSCPRSHYEFVVTSGPVPRIIEYTDPLLEKEDARVKLVEIRGTAHQTVMPGSTHSSGEEICWNQDGEPGAVDARDLEWRAATLAAAALLARYWPTGSRHDTALALAGALLRNGWTTERAEQFIVAVASAAGDTDERDRRTAVQTTATRLTAGEAVFGIPRLKELLDARVVDRVVAWLHLVEVAKPRTATPGAVQPPTGMDAPGAIPEAGRFHLTDLGNSERLVAQHGNRLRYCYAWNRWLVYDQGYWRDDRPGLVVALAKETVRSIYKEAADEPDDKKRAAIASWAKASESHSRINAMVALSQSALPIDHTAFDRDPWLLNCQNGTVDLRSGILRPHQANDWITRQVPVAYDKTATCPTWYAFLTSVLPNNAEMIAFLQRVAGYSATGSVREQCLFFLHGSGSNGKSTFLRTVQTVLGAYAMQAKSELLLAKRDADHPTEVADLFSKRLVVTIEVEDGRRFAEALLKQLTGGDKIRARRMREDHWEFDPTHKILLAANHRPVIRGTDHAIWRRIHLIPFEVKIPDEAQDKNLPDKLQAELPGILSWLVAGCLDWQRGGLRVPDAVRDATENYRAQMDVVAQHLADCCECGPTFTERAGDLYRSYNAYCEANGEKTVLSQRRYGESLTERGFGPDRGSGNVHIRRGLRLRPAPSPPDDDGFMDDITPPQRPPSSPPEERESDPLSGEQTLIDGINATSRSAEERESDPLSDPLSDPSRCESDPCDPNSGIGRDLFSHESVIRDLGSQGSLRSLSVPEAVVTPAEGSLPLALRPCPGCGTPTVRGWTCKVCRTGRAPTATPPAPDAAIATPSIAKPVVIRNGELTPAYTMLTTAHDVQEMLTAVRGVSVVGLDTETTGLDPLTDRLRLIQIATPDAAYMLDAFALDPRLIAPLLSGEGPLLVGHNVKFDLRFLESAGLAMPAGQRLFDTMLAAQLLSAGTRVKHSLAAVAERALGIAIDKTEQKSNWAGGLSSDQLSYAAHDAAILPALAERLRADVDSAGLQRVCDIEMRALPTIAWIEQTGVPFDTAAWTLLATSATAELAAVEQELTVATGTGGLFAGSSTVNWGSTAQVAALLRERGHAVTSTDEEALQELADAGEPLAALLLRHRAAAKRSSTYGADYLKWVNARTRRIHAGLLQLGSDAGRMSCQKPNLQQVPRDKQYRACFRPDVGRVLIKADYAQIELRLAAEVAGDARLIEAFQRGDDLHTVTARTVLGKADVTKADRQAAKAVNFGLLYGMGAEGLRAYAKQEYGVVWSLEEAAAVRSKFFDTYRGLRAWHRGQPDGALDTRTVAGRRRMGITSFTQKLNSPVQGSGADGLKAALGLLGETRGRASSAAPVNVVHDEIVVECDESQAEEARAWVMDAMRAGMETVLSAVSAEVEATICSNWSGSPLSPRP